MSPRVKRDLTVRGSELLGVLALLTVPVASITLVRSSVAAFALWMLTPLKLAEHVPGCDEQLDFGSTLTGTWWLWAPVVLASTLRKTWLRLARNRPTENLASKFVGLVFPLMLVPFAHMSIDEAFGPPAQGRAYGAAALILGPIYVTAAFVFFARLRVAPSTTKLPRFIAGGLCVVGASLGLWEQQELGARCHAWYLGFNPALTDWAVLLPGRLGGWLVLLAAALFFANDPAPSRTSGDPAVPKTKATAYRGRSLS